MAAELAFWCCALPLVGIAVMWAWARVPWFGQFAGLVVLAMLACGTTLGTVLVARDVAATDRLVGVERGPECGSPGRSLPPPRATPVGTHHVQMTFVEAAALGLPVHPSTSPWDVTIRTVGSQSVASYPRDPARGAEAFFAEDGEIGADEVVFVALRDHHMGQPLEPSRIVAHETLELAWFWIEGEMLVIHTAADGGTLELRDEALSTLTRATGTGSLAEPIDSLIHDGERGVFVRIDDDESLAIGHLTANGRWTHFDIRTVDAATAGLSAARSGGLCVWSTQASGGAVHVDGVPLRAHAWPLSLVLQDRRLELIALAIAWLVALFVLRVLSEHARPWWAFGRGRRRAGEVTRGASSEPASWSEKGAPERTLEAGAWLGFEKASPKPEPAFAIDAQVSAAAPAYRDTARETVRARWVARGTRGQVAFLLRQRLLGAVSRAGLIALVVGIPAIAVAIGAALEH